MKFYTAYYWRKGEEKVSLLLQQVRLGGRACGLGQTVLLAAVSTLSHVPDREPVPDLCGTLKDWFHLQALPKCRRKKERALEELRRQLTAILCGREYRRAGVAGIFCLGERCLLFHFGSPVIFLLNQRFLKPHIEPLFNRDAEPVCREGILEPGIRLLFSTESFGGKVPKDQLVSCLGSGSLTDDRQASKRLEELGEYGQDGPEGRGAVLLVCDP